MGGEDVKALLERFGKASAVLDRREQEECLKLAEVCKAARLHKIYVL